MSESTAYGRVVCLRPVHAPGSGTRLAGYAYDPDSTYGHYWVQDFASPR
ncbi:hypothetical protein [Nocardioides sp.]|nr:hypothetical protein [Nocardioides sp.]